MHFTVYGYCIHYILTNFGRCCHLQGGYYYKNRKLGVWLAVSPSLRNKYYYYYFCSNYISNLSIGLM